jgi:hypothetical protein
MRWAKRLGVAVTALVGLAGCGSASRVKGREGAEAVQPKPSERAEAGVTFEDDVAFLKAHGDVIVIDAPGGGQLAVSAKYQGRVMTSAVRPGGKSLGFVHRAFIEKGATATQFDNYGGEDRFWLGPEGGQFGLYFPPGAPFSFRAWQTPHEMQEGEWSSLRAGNGVVFKKRMHVTNASGTEFAVDVVRTVRPIDKGFPRVPGVAEVAYESENRITNVGSEPWTEKTGLLSVWILGMFAPAKDAEIVIPFEPEGDGPIVNDRYFGKVPADRLAIHEREGWLTLKADGEYRSKIGLGPSRSRQVAGSYSPSQNLLTVVEYDRDGGPAKYVNSMWEQQSDPFSGDAINAYNDGPTEPGKPSLGGFYEIETSSPAAALAPGASLLHTHRTFHFVGAPASLDLIARAILGVPLVDVASR